jgi:hypothetical protein
MDKKMDQVEDFIEDEKDVENLNGDLDTFLEDMDEVEVEVAASSTVAVVEAATATASTTATVEVSSIARLQSSASINASSNWETEVEVVRGIYADRITRDFADNSPNRFFTMKFISAQYQDIHQSEMARLENEIKDLTYNIECQEKIVTRLKINKPDDKTPAKKLKELSDTLFKTKKELEYESKMEHYPDLRVTFRFTRRYPRMALDLQFVNTGGLDGSQIQSFYKETSRVMRENLGTPMLCVTIDTIQKVYDDYQPKEADRLKRLEEEHKKELQQFKQVLTAKSNPAWDLNDPSKWVGNITYLLRKLSEKVKVVNVENVLRADLVYRFEKYRTYLRNKYLEGAHNKHHRATCNWAESEVAFHGTRAENVGSIVSSGLHVPGREEKTDLAVKVASGSRYGLGIYTSPDINFSLHYTRGSGRLLVVAVLPGRKFICNDFNTKYGCNCTPGYDSHQSQDKTELVLFKASAVLPCYVVHYKYTSHLEDKPYANTLESLHADPVMNWKLKKKKEQEELKARAMKTLGYGFGPAGKNFVVEAVYGPRDYEEDLSSFQNMHEHRYQRDRDV